MKQLFLCTFFACCLSTAFSQKKATMGLVVKAGNYTLPYQHKTETPYYYGERISNQNVFQKAGANYSVGINGSLRLGGHFRVSSELIYRMLSYSFGSEQEYKDKTGNTTLFFANEIQLITESSLCLPVKIHFSFLKNGKTTIALGAGIFHVLNAANKGQSQNFETGFPSHIHSYYLPSLEVINSDNKPEMTLTAGVYHRIDNNTSIGLEFNYERRSREKIQFSKYAPNSDLGRLSYGYFVMEAPSMRSLSVTLSHNLTK